MGDESDGFRFQFGFACGNWGRVAGGVTCEWSQGKEERGRVRRSKQ